MLFSIVKEYLINAISGFEKLQGLDTGPSYLSFTPPNAVTYMLLYLYFPYVVGCDLSLLNTQFKVALPTPTTPMQIHVDTWAEQFPICSARGMRYLKYPIIIPQKFKNWALGFLLCYSVCWLNEVFQNSLGPITNYRCHTRVLPLFFHHGENIHISFL